MNPLSKLQSEAIKDFKKRFAYVQTSGKNIEQFLSDQIQKAVKKTRKEIIKQIRKMETSSYTLDGAYLNENIDFICKKLKKSSIKRKIK